jgi:hypothetical protein
MTDRRVLAIDFDGTIVEFAFPEIGKELPRATETLRDLAADNWLLVLNTVREDYSHPHGRAYLTEAVQWLQERGVPLAAVNTTPTEWEPRILHGGRKVLATHYIDDRNLPGGFPGWDVIRQELLEGRDV